MRRLFHLLTLGLVLAAPLVAPRNVLACPS